MSNLLAISLGLLLALAQIGLLLYRSGKQDSQETALRKSVERLKKYVGIKSKPRGSDDNLIDRL